MKAIVRIQKVYNTILKETKLELVVMKEGKTFIGPLFFKQMEEIEELKAVIDETQVNGSAMDIVMTCYEMLKKHQMLSKDDKTLQTMLHWQYCNGLTDECITKQYGFSSDAEYFAAMRTGCVSVKSLYEKYGETLSFAEVHYSDDEGVSYYDLYADGKLVCMDGERCRIIDKNDDSISFQNIEGENPEIFHLSKAEFETGYFRLPDDPNPDFIVKMEANPMSDSASDRFFLQKYIPLGNGRAKIGDVLYIGTAEKCCDLMKKLNAGEMTQEQVKNLYVEENKKPEPDIPREPELTALQKKAAVIMEKYKDLPLQEKINVIAQAFGVSSGEIKTSPCYGKWRGTSDICIKFDNGMALGLGNERTPAAKTKRVQQKYIDAFLVKYNPEIISATKEAATAALMQREAKDNAIAKQKGLKPYMFLNVEFNDGMDGNGLAGWYYVTLAVDGKIRAHLESGLQHDIVYGKVSAEPSKKNYYTAGALEEDEVDYVFNNVGFSSTSDMYSLPISDAARKRSKEALAERLAHMALDPDVQPIVFQTFRRQTLQTLFTHEIIKRFFQSHSLASPFPRNKDP